MTMPVLGALYTCRASRPGRCSRSSSSACSDLPSSSPIPARIAVGLGELDLVVLHDLDTVAARVANVEEAARKHLDACFLERAARCLLVVHDEAEVRLLGARPSFEQGEELVAHPEKRRARDARDLCGLEEVGVERDRLLDVVDLERDVVDPDETWLHAAANDGGGRGMPGPRE